MTITVVGSPATANARYFKKLEKIELDSYRLPPRRASLEEIARVHTIPYVRRTSLGFSEEWVGKRPDLVQRAEEAVGSAIRAATHIFRDDSRKIFVPGSGRPHAGADYSDRQCVYNDIAIIASWLTRRNYQVAVIDLDGLYAPALQELLYNVDGTSVYSVHDEIKGGDKFLPAKGIHNFMLDDYSGDYELLEKVHDIIESLHHTLPDVIILNVGATGHESDELSTLQYTLDGIYEACVRISQTADELCGSRMIGLGGVASAGNEWASTISVAATHAMSLPYLASSATRRAPVIELGETT